MHFAYRKVFDITVYNEDKMIAIWESWFSHTKGKTMGVMEVFCV